MKCHIDEKHVLENNWIQDTDLKKNSLRIQWEI